MRVTKVKTFVYCPNRNWVFVKLETDEGITGWGETTIIGQEQSVEACIRDLAVYLVGRDPRHIELHWTTMLRNSWFRPSLVITSAMSALEIAMWDILGKSLDAPVYQLLGGPCRKKLKVYLNDWTGDSPEIDDIIASARRCVDQGAAALKWDPLWRCDVYPGEAQFRRAVRNVALLREAVGEDVELMVDCCGRLSPENAARFAQEIEPYSITWLEEPIPTDADVSALLTVTGATTIPVCVGERIATRRGFTSILENRAAGVLNPDPGHAGGILETKKIADMADAYYIPVNPHNCGGPVLNAANMHIGATIPNFLIHEFFASDMPHFERIIKDGFPVVKDNCLEVSDRPGLGVELDEAALSGKPFKRFDRSGMWAPNFDS
jgi:galactonate dehydratase